jgi:hypothetical protein
MGNRLAIATGLVILLVLLTLPFWYGAITGKAAYVPLLEVPGNERQCVESTSYMRSDHMKLLDRWKEDVVRKGRRTYTASSGKVYVMSLTDTCMRCHSNKEQFCDRCHDYTGVVPKCWSCHVYKREGPG